MLDTVRRDHTGIGPREPAVPGLTPNLDRLAREGTAFVNAWSTAPWTVPAHASLFTGELPSVHGCTSRSIRFRTSLPTLAEIAVEAGYETAAFYSNPWLTDGLTGLLRGYETQYSSPFDQPEVRGNDQGGRQTVESLRNWLAGRDDDRPFFAFVSFLEAHLPYNPEGDYPPDAVIPSDWVNEYNAGLHRPEEQDWSKLRSLYGGDVRFADRFLGDMIDLLIEKSLLEDCIVIVTSDHGENLGEYRFLEHQFGLQETLLAIPLLIRAPHDGFPPGRDKRPVIITDLFPTILEWFGRANEGRASASRSLLDDAGSSMRPVMAEYGGPPRSLLNLLRRMNPDLDDREREVAFVSVREGSWRLTAGSDGSIALHDLDSDPLQRENRAEMEPDQVNRLTQYLLRPGGQQNLSEEEVVEVDEETKQRLRSLGYAD